MNNASQLKMKWIVFAVIVLCPHWVVGMDGDEDKEELQKWASSFWPSLLRERHDDDNEKNDNEPETVRRAKKNTPTDEKTDGEYVLPSSSLHTDNLGNMHHRPSYKRSLNPAKYEVYFVACLHCDQHFHSAKNKAVCIESLSNHMGRKHKVNDKSDWESSVIVGIKQLTREKYKNKIESKRKKSSKRKTERKRKKSSKRKTGRKRRNEDDEEYYP